MANIADIQKALLLFNDKVNKLHKLSFKSELPNSGFSISFNESSGVKSERRGPSEEAIDAFVLTFRFFIQNNEACSLRKLSEYYTAAKIKSECKEKYEKIRNGINVFLDGSLAIKISINGEVLTCRKIIDAFIYGHLAHSNNPENVERYQAIKVSPAYPAIENEFVYILALILGELISIMELNNEVLALLDEQ